MGALRRRSKHGALRRWRNRRRGRKTWRLGETCGTGKEKEEVAARQRAGVDITAVIHLHDRLPKALPGGKGDGGHTRSCVTAPDAANVSTGARVCV